MPLAAFNPKLFDAALASFAAATRAGLASPVLVAVLPGWGKPLTFKLSRDTYYVYLDSANGVRLAVCG
jgi:hypothetical protein